MTFEEAKDILLTKQIYVKKDSLDRVYKVLERLGNPQNSFKAAHITGTNGKGSVCAAMESVLNRAGYKTGLFSSPHLVCVRERIRFCGSMIEKDEFAALFKRVFEVSDKISFFEIITCMAFLYFKEKGVDIAFIEVGIGGKYDTTNVLPPCELCVISSVGIDHVKYLGADLESIARQKAGIIKKGTVCLAFVEDENARRVIKEEAEDAGGKVVFIEREFKVEDYNWVSNSMILRSMKDNKKIEYGLIGENQAINASIAKAGLEVLALKSFKNIDDAAISAGFKDINLEGRFQIIKNEKNTFVLDGAHNNEAIETFAETFKKSPFLLQDTVFVIGILDDKNHLKMLKALYPFLKKAIFTKIASDRSIAPCVLADETAKLNPEIETEVHDDFDAAFLSATKTKVVVVTGSFYLAGAALALIKTQENRNITDKKRCGEKTGEK
ncbi:MAG: bifunctional folylpolyglutamate synthase/dihydrofolate synthase [Elusimicrobiales bacterium]|nr:bifunctional folylpolyglutamate synthase/dihydrofolate synthase [Elusimicrobiales bacterium]